jgi:hypothetical protein
MLCSIQLEQSFCYGIRLYSPMELLEVLDYTTLQTVTVPAGATTGTVSVPTTADTIDEINETLLLPLERLRLLEQSMIMTMLLL